MSDNHSKLELSGIRLERGRRVVLDDVSWRLAHGEHWAMIGANGSGKTSLLQVATGYLWPTQGSVAALGEPYGQVDLRALRRRIGWVSSSLAPLLRTTQPARSIVLSGAFASTALFDRPSPAQFASARDLLALVGCEHLGDSPFGTLSLGEQQRVLIARALMAQPELLILDEACAGLDLPGRECLLGVIDRVGRQGAASLVLVTHHIEEIAPAITHVLVLKAGRVLAQGPKQQVLTADTLSRAFTLHIEVEERFGRYWPRVNGG